MRALAWGLSLVVASGCGSTRFERGALLRTSPARDTCADVRHLAQRTLEGDPVQLTLTTEVECQENVTREYERTRVTQVGAWLMVPMAGAFMLTATGLWAAFAASDPGRKVPIGAQDAVASLVGFGLGLLAGLVVGGIHFSTPAKPELVPEPIGPRRTSSKATTGLLVTSTSPHGWPVDAGVTAVPSEHLREPLWIDGVRVEVSPALVP